MSKGGSHDETIKIFLRIRPAANPSDNYVIDRSSFDKAAVTFHIDKNNTEMFNNQVEDYRFQFDDAFDRPTTQEQIFESVAKPCVDNVTQGYNSTIFAYGQTGSGKTFSITGGSESYAQRGIIPRCIAAIFDYAKRATCETSVRVSYMQIYQDKAQDLLNGGQDARSIEDLPKVSVLEIEDDFVVKNLGRFPCERQEEALNYLFIGDTNRIYCETSMNASSSRSHCIFTIELEQREPGSAVIRRSKLNLVDLAGSERVKKTGAEGKVLQEAKYINLSLHYLQEVIKALSDKAAGRRDHIPYRQSVMTMLLRDSLGGNCKTVMLATAHPQDAFMDETVSTCKFSQRVASIAVNARINEEADPSLLVKKLKAENAALKEELAMLRGGDQAGDRVLSTDEQAKCKTAVHRYIDDPEEDNNFTGLDGDMARIFFCFKYMRSLAKGSGGGGGGGGGGGVRTGSRGSDRAAQPYAEVDSRDSQSGDTADTSNGGAERATPPAESTEQGQAKLGHLRKQLQRKDSEIGMLLNIVQKYQTKKVQAGTQTGAESQPASHTSSEGLSPTSSGYSSQAQKPNGGGTATARATQHQQVEMAALQHKLSSDYNLSELGHHNIEHFKDTTKAFEEFRKSWRRFEQIEKHERDQSSRREQAKDLAGKINVYSKEIASVKSRIQQLRAERATQGWNEPDQEETKLFEQLDAKKGVYRKRVAELSEMKQQYDHFQALIKRSSVKLQQDFESWWTLRKWQATGGDVARSDSIRAFSDQQFRERAKTTADGNLVTLLHPAAPDSKPSSTPAASPPVALSAAPDAEVQSELQKLFKAREQLRSSLST